MKRKNSLSIIILLFLLISVFYPLIGMLAKVEWAEFSKLVTSSAFKESMSNSLLVTTIATVTSIIIAYILAYTLNRTNIEHRAILKILLTLPMLIPSISHGLGLINLFGANGLISKVFGFNIIGMPGIIIGSIIMIGCIYLIGNTLFCGNDTNLVEKALENNSMWYTFIVKALLTALCLAVGFKGGNIGPAFISGATLGILMASLMGIDPQMGAAIGAVSLFGGVTGCYISAVFLGIEIFGIKSLAFFIIIAIMLKYFLNQGLIKRKF